MKFETDVDELSSIIKEVDGNQSLSSGALAKAILEKLSQKSKYGCFVNHPHEILDDCVIDTKENHYCIYAKEGMKKEDCEFWREVWEQKFNFVIRANNKTN